MSALPLPSTVAARSGANGSTRRVVLAGALCALALVAAGLALPKWLTFLVTMAAANGLVSLGIVVLMRGGVVAFGQGMVFAIEPMVNIGKAAVKVLADGWTAVTRDASLSAHFEHTVVVTADGCEILTLLASDAERARQLRFGGVRA